MKFELGGILTILVFQFCAAVPSTYNVGTGIADVTGPAAGVNMVSIIVHCTFVQCTVQSSVNIHEMS